MATEGVYVWDVLWETDGLTPPMLRDWRCHRLCQHALYLTYIHTRYSLQTFSLSNSALKYRLLMYLIITFLSQQYKWKENKARLFADKTIHCMTIRITEFIVLMLETRMQDQPFLKIRTGCATRDSISFLRIHTQDTPIKRKRDRDSWIPLKRKIQDLNLVENII